MSRYFSDEETCCECGCGFNNPSPLLMQMLDTLREKVGGPLNVNCVCRCQEHNDSIPRAVRNSQHVKGKAADVRVPPGMTIDELAELAIEVGFDGIGRYYGDEFVHCDVRDGGHSPNLYNWTDNDL
jgi:uncharacterized protein YcbK (DUF882 family)